MSQQDHSVELRPKLVGKRDKRTEDPRLLTGVGQYVDDMAPRYVAYRIATLRPATCPNPEHRCRRCVLGARRRRDL